ncbi:hypothetical protein GOP47_0024583 [Adiantum capillus-veneris]|uniref:GCVT N-terminal domain-containing protein n=1 Tax=Adiantum capillus-veneris TaxID=13818 RepID=A0A9D4U2D3_ADICA|nr:hypothetical protein GOP47_0024583 [Adiantum capillus-veneris]
MEARAVPPYQYSSTVLAKISHRISRAGARTPSCSSFPISRYGTTIFSKSRSSSPSSFPAASLDFASPPVDFDLHSLMQEMGAVFSQDGVVESFGNDEEALEAATNGVSVTEMSHVGRLRVSGDDRIRFLHNQSTADFQSLSEGQGCDTVFVTPTARTIDLATAWIMKRAVILFISPDMRQSIFKLLNKYIFFADKVEIEDITEKTFFFTIMGRKSDQLMEQLNMKDIVGKPYGTHLHYSIEGTPVTVGVGNLLSKSGYSLMLSTDTAGLVWETLLKFGAVPMGADCWEHLRIQKGRPAPGKELTDEFNVLEAGLWDTISLSKGCYIGQETVARLVTYQGVKQHLWGLALKGPVDPGSIIFSDGEKVGKVTSCSSRAENGDFFGLGYIRKKAGGQGLEVHVGEQSGVCHQIKVVYK